MPRSPFKFPFQEVGNRYSINQSTISNISNWIDNLDTEDIQAKLDNIFPHGELYRLIYKQSIIPDLENHYFNCTKISYHLKNSQKDIDESEYYVYANMIVFLTRIIEEENKRNGAGQENDHTQDYKRMMSQSKRNFSPGKISTPKIPKK